MRCFLARFFCFARRSRRALDALLDLPEKLLLLLLFLVLLLLLDEFELALLRDDLLDTLRRGERLKERESCRRLRGEFKPGRDFAGELQPGESLRGIGDAEEYAFGAGDEL